MTTYRNYFTYIIIVLGLLLSFSVRSAIAANVDFEVSVDRNVIVLGQSLQLQLRFEGSTNVPAPGLDDIAGFQSRYRGPSTSMSVVNGSITSSITHIYSMIPLKTGQFDIGPFTFDYKGDTYKSNSVKIDVVDSHSAGNTSRKHTGPDQTNNDRISLVMEANRSSAYINELISLTIKLYINSLSVRDIEYPVLEHDGISIGKFEEPRQYQERKGGLLHDVIEFRTIMFATRSGDLSIGPAKIKSNLVIKNQRHRFSSTFDGFFNGDFFGYEKRPIELVSEPVSLKILSLPKDGKPDDFKGAVGSFSLNVLASPTEVMAGDPVTLKLLITGNGNFDTVTGPVFKNEEGFKIYEPQVVKGEQRKEFEHVLIPRDETITKLPDIYFSFFDPADAKYRTIVKKDMPIKVLKPQRDEELTILDSQQPGIKTMTKEMLGRDIIYIKGYPGKLKTKGAYLYKKPLFYIINVLPLLLFISLWILRKKQIRLSSDIGYARRISALKKAKKGLDSAGQYLNADNPDHFYDAISRTLREYLGNRFQLSSGGMTVDIVDSTIKDKGINVEILNNIKMLFQECDMARYASKELGTVEMEATLTKLKEVINHCEKIR